MSYSYEKEKPEIFTEAGMEKFIAIRDRAKRLLNASGSVRMDALIIETTGSNWFAMACVDRLVEKGELIEISQEDCPGQYRIFTSYITP